MQFEFDPAKDEANRFTHGLRLRFAERVFASSSLVVVASHRQSMARIASRLSRT
jgi:uncharacterized DUF497 family protein